MYSYYKILGYKKEDGKMVEEDLSEKYIAVKKFNRLFTKEHLDKFANLERKYKTENKLEEEVKTELQKQLENDSTQNDSTQNDSTQNRTVYMLNFDDDCITTVIYDDLEKAKKAINDRFDCLRLLGKKYDVEEIETCNGIFYRLTSYCDLYLIGYDSLISTARITKHFVY